MSNTSIVTLKKLLKTARIKPAVNQARLPPSPLEELDSEPEDVPVASSTAISTLLQPALPVFPDLPDAGFVSTSYKK